MSAGYHTMSIGEYAKDPAPTPSVSKGVVLDAINLSMRHAHLYHPRLGGVDFPATPRSDRGSAVHSLVLGGAGVEYCDADDWRTNAAKAVRDNARLEGKIPLLLKHKEATEYAAMAAKAEIDRFLADEDPTSGRQYEQSMIWQDGGVWCRGRPDLITDRFDIDLKTVDSLDLVSWIRFAAKLGGYDVQSRLRERGHAILGQPRTALWLLVELEAPHETLIVAPSARMRTLADQKIDLVLPAWRRCLDDGVWPGMRRGIYYADPPASAEMDLAERKSLL